ncbi:MAG: transporter [Thermodesulfobacteriota bacterium]
MKRVHYLILAAFIAVTVSANAYAQSDVSAEGQGGPNSEVTEAEKIEEAKKSLEEAAPTRTRLEEIKRGGLLLKKKIIEIDTTFTYAHFSENQLVIDGFAILPVLVIGEINVEKIKQDILILTETVRYGLTDRVQFEVSVPYRYHYQRFFRPDVSIGEEEVTNKSNGIGDVSGTLLYHLLNENAVSPHLVAGLTLKTATGASVFNTNPEEGELPMGTGFYSLRGSLSFVKTADPAVVFWNIGYTRNFLREGNVFVAIQDPDTKEISFTEINTKLEPGDTFEFGFGVAYALSYKLALNTQYQQSISLKTKRDGMDVAGTFFNSGAIRIGGAWAWSDESNYHLRSLDLSASFGVTVDAPDTVVELRFTHRF